MKIFQRKSSRPDHGKYFFILLFLLPLILRLAFIVYVEFFMLSDTDFKLGDESDYHYRTVALLRGASVNISTDKFGYYAFLAPIYFVFGYHRIAVVIIQCILGAFACVLVFQITAAIFSRKAGIAAWFLCAVYPSLIWWCGFLLKEALLIFLFVMMLYAVVKAGRSESKTGVILWTACLIIIGFYMGLTRLTSLAFIPAMILWLILFPRGIKGKIFRLLIVAVLSGLFLLSLKMPLAPFNRLEYSKITPARLVDRWVESFSSPSERYRIEKHGFKDLYRFWRERPWSFIRRVPLVWRAFPDKTDRDFPALVAGMVYLCLIPFAAYGFVCALSWKPREAIFLFLLLLIFTLIHIFTFQRLRFRIQVMPVFLIFAAVGLSDTYDYCKGLIKNRRSKKQKEGFA